MGRKDLSAIILAAGESGRMGRFKPLLPLGDQTVVERVVTLYRNAGIEDICVVIGYNGESIRRVLKAYTVRCVENPDIGRGMFSSVLTGVSALPDDCGGFFIHPVDIPLVQRSTLFSLMAAYIRRPTHVMRPVFNHRRGHPPLVPGALARHIRKWSGQDGLRGFWKTQASLMTDVQVADEGILLDMDTESDYQQLLQYIENDH